MEQQFKRAQIITIAMSAGVFVMGVMAFIFSERQGYGASSEAKMNFLRVIVLIVSLAQIIMAFALKKIISAAAGSVSKEKKLLAAQVTANVLCEAVAIFGFVLTVMSKTFMDYAIFSGLSIGALALFFPKRSDWFKGEVA